MEYKKLADIIAEVEIKKAINKWGVEITEDKIKKCYKTMPYLKWSMLKIYYKITNRENVWKQMEK